MTHRLLPVAALGAFGLFAACETVPQPTPLEAVATGAAVGAIVGNESDNLVEGAVVGGIVGAATASLLGQTEDGQCRYREIATGREFVAAC